MEQCESAFTHYSEEVWQGARKARKDIIELLSKVGTNALFIGSPVIILHTLIHVNIF